MSLSVSYHISVSGTNLELIIANRFYPSSQLCSHCGHQQKMPLHKRIYECGNCGFKADRDLNAAVNLEKYLIA